MSAVDREAELATLARAAGDLVTTRPEGHVRITDVAYDSRAVRPGALFACIPGHVTDGHRFAGAAVKAGASALLVERPLGLGVPEIVVRDARRATALVAARFFGRPADAMLMLGVTGTNGKTTTAFLLDGILREVGYRTGLIGTVETRVGDDARPGVRTTPESVDLQRLLADMVDHGVGAVAMEVTSHALVLGRVEGVRFAAAGFTNLSQDHLDFHASMEDYFAAKSSLFVAERVAAGAVNVDDPYGQKLMANSEVPNIGFGVSREADVVAHDIALGTSGSSFTLTTPDGTVEITTDLVGHFNIFNCLAAAAIAAQAGIELAAIANGLKNARQVPGRFETVDRGQPFSVVIDYAHTPDSLDNVLRAARTLAGARNGRVLVAFGCGGDRDRGKRPLMGAIAVRRADVVVVTSDNPRTEDPEGIIGEILAGARAEDPAGVDHVQPDRRAAIEWLLAHGRAGDVAVIAGKGHETGQEFADRTIPFDDRVVAAEILATLGMGDGA